MAAPVFSNLNNRPVFVENGASVVLDNDATLTDPDGDPFDGTTLRIFINDNAVLGGSGTLSFVAGDVLIGAVVIGTYVDSAGLREITFDADATNARVNELLQQLTYRYGSAPPASESPPEFDFVEFIYNNSDSTLGTLLVDIVPLNDAPAIAVAATAGYQAGSAGTPLSGTVDVSDVDSPLIAGATVRITNGIASDTLSANVGSSGIVASYDAASRTLTLSGARTQAQYEEVLGTVTYSSSAADPTNGGANPTRMIEWQINDGEAASNLSNIATTTLSFGAGTVVPYVDLDQSSDGTAFTTAFGEQGAAIPIADSDTLVLAGNTQITSATIVLTNRQVGDTMAIAGVLPSGISAAVDTTNPSVITVTLSGAASAAAYQTALERVVFGNANDNPNTTARDIAVTVSNGNTSNTAHTRVNINVTDDFVTATEDRLLVRSEDDGVLANDNDPDGGLHVNEIGVTLTTDQGGEIAFGADGSYVYAPPAGFSGRDTVTFTVDDLLAETMESVLTIDVLPAADQPQLHVAAGGPTGLTPASAEHTSSLGGTDTSFVGDVFALAHGGYAVTHNNISATDNTDRDAIVQLYHDDGTPNGGPIQLDGAEETQFVLARPLTEGGFAAAWFAGVGDFRMQVFADDGSPVSAQIPFAEALSNLTPLSNGNFAVTSSSGASVLVRIFDEEGHAASGPITINAPGRVTSAIVPDTDGGFIVAARLDVGGGQTSIVAQRYDADGSLDGPEVTVRGPESSLVTSGPSIASLADGRFMVTWGESITGSDVINQRIHAQVIGTNDQPLGAEIISGEIVSTSLFGVFAPRVNAIADGFVLRWESASEVGVDDIGPPATPSALRISGAFQVYDGNGQAVSDEVVYQVNPGITPIGSGRVFTAFTALPDGGFAVTSNDVSPTTGEFNAFVQVFDGHGNRVGNEILLGAGPGDRRSGALAALPNGDLVAAWHDSPTLGHNEINSRLFHLQDTAALLAGTPLTIPLTLELNDLDVSETITRIEIVDVPAGATLSGPAGTTATFNPGSGVWTLTGTLTTALTLTMTPPVDFAGTVSLHATAFLRDGAGGPEAASGQLELVVAVAANDVAPLDDVLWRHATGDVETANRDLGNVSNTWGIDGTGDFDRDGDADILWRHDEGATVIWELEDGNLVTNRNLPTVSTTWQIAGTGDFDADGDADIAWRNDDGRTTIWEIEDNALVANHNLPDAADAWEIAGTGDFDRDGDADLLWRNDDGRVTTWEMEDGALVTNHNLADGSPTWHIAGTGDLDADGDADIVWHNDDGRLTTWEMEDGALVTNHNLPAVATTWHVAGVHDFDADGDADILWRNDDGRVVTWEMEDAAFVRNHSFGSVSQTWQISGTGAFDV
jgi:hypothetical protein